MMYPESVVTRFVEAGGALSITDGRGLEIRAVTVASRPLVHLATGIRLEKTTRTQSSPLKGESLWWEAVATDQSGAFVDPLDDNKVIVLAEDEHTHTYTTTLTIRDAATTIGEYVIGPYTVPAGATVIDIDLLQVTDVTSGTAVPIPESWSQIVANAEAATVDALAARELVEEGLAELEPSLTDIANLKTLTTTGRLGEAGLSATIDESTRTLLAGLLNRDPSRAFLPIATSGPTISYSANNGPSMIANPVEHNIGAGPFVLQGASGYRAVTSTADWRDPASAGDYIVPRLVGNELPPMILVFDTDAPLLEIVYQGTAGPTYRMAVNGEWLTPLPVAAGGATSGAQMRMRVGFASRRMRRIMIETGGGMPLKSITTSPVDTVSAVAAAPLSLATQGDSYVGSGGADGIGVTAARLLGVRPYVNGSGGTGWLNNQGGNAGKQVYIDRLPEILANKPTMLVGLGGINDGLTGLQAAIEAWGVRARELSPKTIPIVCGPEAPPSTPPGTKPSILRAAAAAQGMGYIDMSTGHVYGRSGALVQQGTPWITGTGSKTAPTGDGNADIYIGFDRLHATAATTVADLPSGVTYHGIRLATALQALIAGGL